ncbi:MAG TPA: ATP-binding protein [Accumulibacter sp.]|uniref:ATP-binding protein n=1 Tax=Accumulibacter sp. TaxID=2053492 RepID=UPI002C9433B5|nr:ATP-binding protein [Accumulibacter sp.]HMV05441.1 ATP-binding protein [Accumulibacter sp.]HND39455.1 ATP-binding protein [Accumulibacter sp.]
MSREQLFALLPGSVNPLARLLALRRVEIVAQCAVLMIAVGWLRIPLAVVPMTASIALLALANLLTRWRLEKGGAVRHGEVLAQLVLDVAVLALLLYFAGGSANPFVSLFLLPPMLAAVMLPAAYAWAMAGLTLFAYTFLMFWKLPLPAPQGDLAQLDALFARAAGGVGEHLGHSSGFALHVLGMWLNFVISLAVVAFFLTRMAAALEARERELAAAREDALRNEQVLALGTLAAGAAHQLGTPLATMAVIIRELELAHADGELRADLLLLREQVYRCKQTISQILASTGHERAESRQPLRLDAFVRRLLDEWQVIRPQVRWRLDLLGEQSAPWVAGERTLEQAILNLLDNAADASSASVTGAAGSRADGERPSEPAVVVAVTWDAACCRIDILDRGPGLPEDMAKRFGRAFASSKTLAEDRPGGLGLGLFLANATIERFGGKVELFNRGDSLGGACTRISLPLQRLTAGAHVGHA